ncbi:GntR family transcriptional regulator [Trinickia sp. YCB016]
MTAAPPKLKRSTLAVDAYVAVRDLLLDGNRYAPGDKISVEELAGDLGVSRSPVWSAVARLEAEGIVEVTPRQGVFLIAFEPARLAAVFEAREALEGMAARLAARRISTAELAALADSIDHQSTAIRNQDRAAYDQANLQFHHGLLDAAQSPAIKKTLSALYAQTRAMCGKRATSFAELQANRDEHEAILRALQAQDENAAERTARRHVAELLKKLLQP